MQAGQTPFPDLPLPGAPPPVTHANGINGGAFYAASVIGNALSSDGEGMPDARSYITQCCETLVAHLGVFNVWIVLTEGQKITTLASSFDQGVLPLREKIEQGWLPVCARRALEQEGVAVIEDIARVCVECPLSIQYNNRVGLSCRIEREGHVFGVIRLSAPEYMAHDRHIHQQLENAARQLAETLHQMAERLRMERELRESRRQLASLMNSLPGMAYQCRNDPQWTMLFVSEGCRELTGYTREDLQENRNIAYGSLIHPDDQERVQAAVREGVTSSRPFTMEYRIINAAGEERWVWERGLCVPVPGKDDVMLEGFITDVTDRLQMQEHIINLQKQECLSVMAGGVAHDFNNILTAVMGNAEVALGEVTPGSDAYSCIEQIIKSSQQAAELCHKLLYFCGRSIAKLSVIEINRLVEGLKPLLAPLIPRNVEVEYALEDELPVFSADPSDLRQIVTQLAVNAAESYAGRGGRVSISTGADFFDGKPLPGLINSDPAPADWYVWLRVEDKGCGVDASTRAKMFDPFFSTKFTGRGMGLAAVYGIVHTLKGRIVVHSQPGEGTSVTVLFPASRAETGC